MTKIFLNLRSNTRYKELLVTHHYLKTINLFGPYNENCLLITTFTSEKTKLKFRNRMRLRKAPQRKSKNVLRTSYKRVKQTWERNKTIGGNYGIV